MARVWKARKGHTFAGSNPALSARADTSGHAPDHARARFFVRTSGWRPFGIIQVMRASSRLNAIGKGLAQGGWLALAGLSLALYVRGWPLFVDLLQQPCAGPACAYGQLVPEAAAALAGRGVSLGAYAALSLTLQTLAALLALLVAVVIFWRRRDDLAALAMALLLVTLPQSNVVQYLRVADPAWVGPLEFLGWVTASCLPAVFYTFPDGRFVPRWTRWLALAWVGLMLLDNYRPGWLQRYLSEAVLGLVFVAFFASFVLALVARFFRAEPNERQQIKWVVFGGGVALGLFALDAVLSNLTGEPLLDALQPLVDFQFMALLALSVGVAILRHQLWDIDRLINRALVYGLLTVALSLVYLGSVVVLQTTVRLVSGGDSPLAVVGSTLLLAALFRPLRTRVQASIDRRFYRRKYNAGQVLAQFGALLRDDAYADLDQATEALVDVVAQTLQPSHVSLWLPPAKGKTEAARSN